MRTETTSTVSNGKRTTAVTGTPAYRVGDEVSVKFEGCEEYATITGGPYMRGVSRHDRGYVAWDIRVDDLDSQVTEVAEEELF